MRLQRFTVRRASQIKLQEKSKPFRFNSFQ
jgi:hypothetical protein